MANNYFKSTEQSVGFKKKKNLNLLVHQQFEEQVEKTPNQIAVEFKKESLTYREINQRANQLAYYLLELGVKKETLVAIYLDRTPNTIIAILAILKAGGTYVPIDLEYPPNRVQFILENCQAPFVISNNALRQNLSFDKKSQLINLDEKENYSNRSAKNLNNAGDLNQLMYVIHTSGSTGTPKGVMITHRNIIHYLRWFRKEINFQNPPRIDCSSSFAFDFTISVLFTTLTCGGTVVLCPQEIKKNPQSYLAYLEHHQITCTKLTPSYFASLIPFITPKFDLKNLQYIILGGESCTSNPIKTWLQHFPNHRFINHYGPTETTVGSTMFHINPKILDQYTKPPIGNSANHAQIYIVSENGKNLEDTEGELYIGGAGVARGYLNQPELTQEKFIPNPFSDNPDDRLYKTGDLVKKLPDGNLVFLGRIDNQVKIRGFRVELEEIEHHLNQFPSILQSVVVTKKQEERDESLMAFIIPEKDKEISLEALQDYLKNELPNYMIPSAFIQLDQLPLNTHGKVDRQALQNQEHTLLKRSKVFHPATNSNQEKLVHMWAIILDMPADQISIEDNFFELGGHSLTAAKLAWEMNKEFHTNFSIADIFEYASISKLDNRLDSLRCATCSMKLNATQSLNDHFPLTEAQLQIWMQQQITSSYPLFNESKILTIQGDLDVQILEQSLNYLIEHHDILRTCFISEEDQVLQCVKPFQPIQLDITDLRAYQESEKQERAKQLAHQQATKLFDLEKDLLIRFSLIQLENKLHQLYITAHHLVQDGISMYQVFIPTLEKVYLHFINKQENALPEPTWQYQDYAVSEQQHRAQCCCNIQALSYWKKTLQDLPILELPTPKSRPEKLTPDGARYYFQFSDKLSEQLKNLARQNNSTHFLMFLTILNILFYRYTGQTDIPIGSIVSGRNSPETEKMMGNFVNTIILRNTLNTQSIFLDTLKSIQQNTLTAYKYQEFPYQEALKLIKRSHHNNRQAIQAMLVMDTPSNLKQSDWSLSLSEIHTNTAKFELIFHITNDQSFGGYVEYNTHLFDQPHISRMVKHLEILCQYITKNPTQAINQLELLSPSETANLLTLARHNAQKSVLPNQTISALFEQQVIKTPKQVAIQYKDQKLTYEALNNQANQLAHYLIKKGLKPQQRVSVFLNRNISLIIAILAVLKAGATYVPIDPQTPKDRTTYILLDTQSQFLITETSLRVDFSKKLPHACELIDLIEISAELQTESTENLAIEKQPTDLMYIIYTSGSTGNPKGVLIEHQQVIQLFQSTQSLFQFNQDDIWTLFHSCAFDFSVWEMFGALLHGSKLIVIPYELSRSPSEFYELLISEKVTVLNQTPSAFQQLIPNKKRPTNLRWVVFGGEALNFEILQSWQDQFQEKAPQFINMFGITETTIHTTYFPIDLKKISSQKTSIIGKPIPGITTYVLDEKHNLQPVGIPGELYVGGSGVARGYLNQKELTQERFIQNPFSNDPKDRLYRTGDLVRWLRDGNLEYLGRIDQQVKIRGFRIELGEIENALLTHPRVKTSCVTVRKDLEGNYYLAAFLTLEQENCCACQTCSCHDGFEIRQYLSEKLPKYMMPATFTFLDTLPLTVNGKVDKKALPNPDRTVLNHRQNFIAPATKIEKQLSKIWESSLQVKNIGKHDDFFELGGYSILASQTLAKIKKVFHVNIPMCEFFQAPTIAEFSLKIEEQINHPN